ncbi:TraU family protein [Orientia tsutsugamushi]|uniref:TraU family protein n=1 Tax=Orientia tsutsugamushi TaxID=784 RepID=UPI0035287899
MKELVILLAIVMSITANNCYAAAGCVGRFVNSITDVCWKCLFPITIAGFKVVSSSMPDTNASGRLICLCPKPGIPIPVPSIPVGFWEPVRFCRCYKITNVYGKSWGGHLEALLKKA